jgi:hypothetical protein
VFDMPITNAPIKTQKALGETVAQLGLVTQTMMPGLMLAVIIHALALLGVEGQHQRAFPFSVTVLAAYWLYVGNDKKTAWENLTRHIENPEPFIGSTPNKRIFPDTEEYRYVSILEENGFQEKRFLEHDGADL